MSLPPVQNESNICGGKLHFRLRQDSATFTQRELTLNWVGWVLPVLIIALWFL
jgi:hypothetical protein